MSMSSYFQNAIVRHTLGIASYSAPATVYVGLLSSVSSDGGSYTELSGSGYARQSLAGIMSAASGGSSTNSADITFPTALASWGTAAYVGLFSASSGGQLLWYNALAASKLISTSAIFTIVAGSLSFNLGGAFGSYLRNGILDYIFNSGSLPSAPVYAGVGASVGATLSSLSEPSAGYSRVLINTWSSANPLYKITDPDLTFTATGDWGSITHLGIYDAATAGNLLYALALSPARTIYDGDGLTFDSSTPAVTLQVD